MDNVLQALLTWQFLFFCLAIGAIVFMVRVAVEYAMVNWAFVAKESKLWRGLILPILPILLGQFGALFITQYPYPEGLSSKGGRMVFGLVAGFTSGLIVRLYRSFLAGKASEYGSSAAAAINAIRAGKNNQEVEDLGTSVRDSINKDQ
jgi:hypothetical protein